MCFSVGNQAKIQLLNDSSFSAQLLHGGSFTKPWDWINTALHRSEWLKDWMFRVSSSSSLQWIKWLDFIALNLLLM